MDAAQKLKIALDETRMLILGAQVLLGFRCVARFKNIRPGANIIPAVGRARSALDGGGGWLADRARRASPSHG
jgi:hypothetical protein